MRRELITLFAAIAASICVAFAVPLGLSAQSRAREQALDSARLDAARMVPVVASGDLSQIDAMVAGYNAGGDVRATVVVDRVPIGDDVADPDRLDRSLAELSTLDGEVDGGIELVTAVALGGDRRAAIRIMIPSGEYSGNAVAVWARLAAVSLVLVSIASVAADRASRRIVSPSLALADAARRLGEGEVGIAVEPAGPPELRATAVAFTELSRRVATLVDGERELLASLAHRLRTPLTKLRIDIDRVDHAGLASDLREDVDLLTDEIDGMIRRARRAAVSAVDVVATARLRFAFWAPLAEDEGRPHAFRTTLPSWPLDVVADELAAVIDVMIENVFSHTPPGTEYAVWIERGDGVLYLGVDDAGTGFAATAASGALGEPERGSTGLGLGIAEEFARSLAGELRRGASSLGGARVELTLPDRGLPVA